MTLCAGDALEQPRTSGRRKRRAVQGAALPKNPSGESALPFGVCNVVERELLGHCFRSAGRACDEIPQQIQPARELGGLEHSHLDCKEFDKPLLHESCLLDRIDRKVCAPSCSKMPYCAIRIRKDSAVYSKSHTSAVMSNR